VSMRGGEGRDGERPSLTQLGASQPLTCKSLQKNVFYVSP
jgi:hypothetical protein